MQHVSRQVALVTGAGGMAGRAICAALAGQGVVVAANDLSPASLEQALSAIKAVGGQGQEYLFDTGKKMPLQALVSQVVEDWGRLDILVNAGIVQPVVPMLDMDEWDWHRTLDVNLGGPFFAIQVAGRVMRQQGGGVILNLAFPPEELTRYGGRGALASSQAGLLSLTRAAAAELAPYGVRANAVLLRLLPPESGAPIRTQPGRVLFRPVEDPYALEAVSRQIAYLCSPQAEAISGKVFSLQGGEWHQTG